MPKTQSYKNENRKPQQTWNYKLKIMRLSSMKMKSKSGNFLSMLVECYL